MKIKYIGDKPYRDFNPGEIRNVSPEEYEVLMKTGDFVKVAEMMVVENKKIKLGGRI